MHTYLQQTHLNTCMRENKQTNKQLHSMGIIQVYAPATDQNDEEVKKFCDFLESATTKSPRRTSSSDTNAKVEQPGGLASGRPMTGASDC